MQMGEKQRFISQWGVEMVTRFAQCLFIMGMLHLFPSTSLAVNHTQDEADLADRFEMPLDELLSMHIVSASKHREPHVLAPSTVYVITQEEIERFGFRFLQDALKIIPSVYIYDPHSWIWGGQRGFVSNFSQTLLLVNGREVNDLVALETYISRQFATHNIERIEVMASPGSALYGANALAGLINIITKDAGTDAEGFQVGVEGGSYQSTGVDVVFARKTNGFRVSGNARIFRSQEANHLDFVKDSNGLLKGWTDAPWALTNISQYKNPSEAWTLSLQLEHSGVYAGYFTYTNKQSHGMEKRRWEFQDASDNRQMQLFYVGFDKELSDRLGVKLEYQHIRSKVWGKYAGGLWPVARLQASTNIGIYNIPDLVTASDGTLLQGQEAIQKHYGSFAAYLVDQGTLDPNNLTHQDIQQYFTHIYSNKSENGSTRNRVDLDLDWEAFESSILSSGVAFDLIDYVGLAVTDAATGIGATYDVPMDLSLRDDVYDSLKMSLYIQYKSEIVNDLLWLTAGARYDYQNHYGGEFNPRASVVIGPGESHFAKLMYSEAYREPNVFELSSNSSLKPAKLRSLELQYIGRFWDNLTIQFAGFRNHVANFLESVGSVVGTGIGSVDSQTVYGLEFRSVFRTPSWYVFIQGAQILSARQEFQKSTGQSAEQDVLGIPKFHGTLGAAYTLFDRYHLAALYSYTRPYDALSGNLSLTDPFQIPEAHEVGLTFSVNGFELSGYRFCASLTVNNLLARKIYHANIRRSESGTDRFLQNGTSVFARLQMELPDFEQ